MKMAIIALLRGGRTLSFSEVGRNQPRNSLTLERGRVWLQGSNSTAVTWKGLWHTLQKEPQCIECDFLVGDLWAGLGDALLFRGAGRRGLVPAVPCQPTLARETLGSELTKRFLHLGIWLLQGETEGQGVITLSFPSPSDPPSLWDSQFMSWHRAIQVTSLLKGSVIVGFLQAGTVC